jgi:hypothetical protein
MKRNRERFPDDFAFQLQKQEITNLLSQFAISSSGHGGLRKRPWVFTEYGALMAANVLRSDQAIRMAEYAAGTRTAAEANRVRRARAVRGLP